jgi:adenylate cyclase
MGSDTRFDYTALGDPVNVASRLEGQSRYYGANVILGSATAMEVMNELAVIELDTVRVVGKAQPENIFALLGDENLRKDPKFQQAFDMNSSMLAAYRAQDWDSVEKTLPQISQIFSELKLGLEGYIDIYRKRTAGLRMNPPGQDWDGVFSFTQKVS